MPLLRLNSVSLGYGGPPLLEGLNLRIERGERVCLLGRNGAGKTSLLRVASGELLPDDGEVLREEGLRSARLAQELPRGIGGPVFDVTKLE